ncbi:hypothetical protein HZ326_2506 [Fusarium oxysporum f. sp. albedinis]|nr:hypothetical protein HZ326_2506 [Fusarium oxysporum f. sp. albedinis]
MRNMIILVPKPNGRRENTTLVTLPCLESRLSSWAILDWRARTRGSMMDILIQIRFSYHEQVTLPMRNLPPVQVQHRNEWTFQYI